MIHVPLKSEIFLMNGNGCSFTDGYEKKNFTVCMHLDIYEPILFKCGLAIDETKLFISILV